eukprot:scaffold1218_cov15-Tisochrysis_lutea.AAC.1
MVVCGGVTCYSEGEREAALSAVLQVRVHTGSAVSCAIAWKATGKRVLVMHVCQNGTQVKLVLLGTDTAVLQLNCVTATKSTIATIFTVT